MSGRPHIMITESVAVLLEIRKQQKSILAYIAILNDYLCIGVLMDFGEI